MKKIYQIPDITIVHVSQNLMNPASLPTSEGPADPNKGMLSKGGSMLWSDDDYDYEEE